MPLDRLLQTMMDMSAYIAVDPNGDLTTAIGRGSAQKLVKISSATVKRKSPVFRAMLGPSFREGRITHDDSNPLTLPDDDPTSMINLFQIMHGQRKQVDTEKQDWIQELVVVCDKYECAWDLMAFIHTEMERNNASRLRSSPDPNFPLLDALIIAGLTGDRECFEKRSKYMTRIPYEEL